MPRGLSLHIGLNELDPNHYAGWNGKLNACEADAEDMRDIAHSCGYEQELLLTKQATREAVLAWLGKAVETLQSGDILLLTYSGHGGQLPDLSGDEPDRIDETWCLYDGQLVDDELYGLYGRLRAGVRGFVLSDSCHSGTVLKKIYYEALSGAAWTGPASRPTGPESGSYKFMPAELARRVYKQNREQYDTLLKSAYGAKEIKNSAEIAACVRLISGCQDNQYSLDGTFNSAFTAELLAVWNNGKFDGGYSAFHRAIQAKLPPSQSPNHFVIGPSKPDFDRQRPFTI
jgi:metacaspase-1